jgi:hypothetical protein
MDAIDVLNRIVREYQARSGRFPDSWGELIATGVLRRVPADPAGVPFLLNGLREDVRISRQSPLWPLPQGFESYGS